MHEGDTSKHSKQVKTYLAAFHQINKDGGCGNLLSHL